MLPSEPRYEGMRKSVLFFLMLALYTDWAGSLGAQSLAELARQQRARIAEQGAADKVYTNDDLPFTQGNREQGTEPALIPPSGTKGNREPPALQEKRADKVGGAPQSLNSNTRNPNGTINVTPPAAAETSELPAPKAASVPPPVSRENGSGEVHVLSAKFSNPYSSSATANAAAGASDQVVSPAPLAPASPPVSAPDYGFEEKGAGELNVLYQSFYNRINNSTTANVNGAAVSYVHFYPRLGLLSLRFEPLTDRGGFTTGENFAQWKGFPWKGKHWDFALGDFHTSTALQPMPFTNLIQPDFFLRGAKVTASSNAWRYSLYAGQETLSQGQRIPFRTRVPQTALGADAAGQPLEMLKIGFRYLHLSSSSQQVVEQASLFPLNRQFLRSDSLTAQAEVKLLKNLEWYTETGWSNSETLQPAGPRNTAYSLATGPSWKTPRLVIQANYVREGVGYLPLLGSYLGDRQGPNADAILHLGRAEFSGSWSQSRNNLEQNPNTPNFFSRQSSGGMNVRLPFKFSLGASVSKIALETRSPDQPTQLSDNRQLNVTLSRPLFSQNLRTTFQQMDMQFVNSAQRLRFLELEDNYHWRRFTVGGAARWQHFSSGQHKDSFFARGTAQVQLWKLSLYSYIEQGKDLPNSTLFATNIISTSVVGLSWFAAQRMSVQLEAFRNNINSNLNPASIFVLASQGIPIDTTLARFNNWSVYLRVARRFDWGEHSPLDASGNIQRQAPVVGSLAGFVKVRTMAGSFGAPSVSVVLDAWRPVPTDATGYFQVSEVPEGTHTVALDIERLPADLNPSDPSELSVQVRHDQLTRLELAVIPLQAAMGRVSDAAGAPAPEGILVRLSPGDHSTTTDRSGRFGFYNLPEGDYVAEVDTKSLPEYAQLVTAPRLPLPVRYGKSVPEANVIYQIVPPPPKPLQKILLGSEMSPAR